VGARVVDDEWLTGCPGNITNFSVRSPSRRLHASDQTCVGPIVMMIFALFANCLLITILISILSNTFATVRFLTDLGITQPSGQVQQNAVQYYLFERTVHTLERIKSDALLEYTIPGNLVGLLLVGPAKLILNERYLHTVHVFVVRLTSVHILLPIALYRRWQHSKYKRRSLFIDSPTQIPRSNDTLMSSIPKRLLDGGSRTTFLTRQVFERPVNQERVQAAAGFVAEPVPVPTPEPAKPAARDVPPASGPDEERLARIEKSLLGLGAWPRCFRD
jgi:hypothetical protein